MGKIRVANGDLVDPYNLRYEDVQLDVIAHSLSQINRFTGHAKFPYSVGQHTINLALAMRRMYSTYGTFGDEMARAAFAHDMSEAFFNDLASPVKRENPDYKRAEHAAGVFICEVLEVDKKYLEWLDTFDKSIYKNERDALFPVINGRGMGDDQVAMRSDYIWPGAFKEYDWRSVRGALWYAYKQAFNRHTAFVPFWERKDYNG